MATIKVLVVGGGGGGGGGYEGGGGGAGAVRYDAAYTVTSQDYAVTVGNGGNGEASGVPVTSGQDSIFGTITAVGGGHGADENQFSGYSAPTAENGGSGGGGGGGGTANAVKGTGTTGGNDGGTGARNTDVDGTYAGGGGGGAGGAGGNATATSSSSTGGNGGSGVANSITGSSVTYGGGGGGSSREQTNGTGGSGGGGNAGATGGNGTDGLGGGGGAGRSGSGTGPGGNGGKGVVIISYVTSDFGSCTGGTITTSGLNTIHTFTSSGTFTVTNKIKKILGVEIANIKKVGLVYNKTREFYYGLMVNDANKKAYYRFENGALTTDSGSNGYTLTNVGSITNGGNIFDFGDDCADLGTNNTTKGFYVNSALGITTNRSFSIWIKMREEISSDVQYPLYWFNGTTGVRGGIIYDYNGGTRRLRFSYTKNGVEDYYMNYNVTLGTTLHNIIYTYDGSYVRGYLDGSAVGTPLSVSGTGNAGSSYFTIGTQNTSVNYGCCSMYINDVVAFDDVLSATEASNIYNNYATTIKKIIGVNN